MLVKNLIRNNKLFLKRSIRCFSTKEQVVPVIDLAPSFENDEGMEYVANQIGSACEKIGFFVITSHNVNPQILDKAWNTTREYFDLPEEEKNKVPMLDFDVNPYGYSGFLGETLSKGKSFELGADNVQLPDLKESFSIGPYNPSSGMPLTRWPKEPPYFQEDLHNYYREMEKLADHILSLFATTLDLPKNWFEQFTDKHCSALRLLNYPDLDFDPPADQLRASAHSDYGTITILRQDFVPGGLQVLNRNNEWCSVVEIPDAYVINIGDLMARWTNHKWVSTLHRVVNPPTVNESKRRQSIAFFHNLNSDATVACIDSCQGPDNPRIYDPIKAGDLLASKHTAATTDL